MCATTKRWASSTNNKFGSNRLQCPGNQNIPSSEYKHCGGCSLVAYCSQPCQKADWLTFHRAECIKARCERSGMLFHVLFISR
ncbi:hypothetical protein FA13DRAFT_1741186 [Coprinellus micaceus]|uniref:MYND-type domain-containing protein n=1 Tax=Coprinellus micaceus TaxID=71717 RepID=A0A4Y7SK91_COPMI|nr:hypothetical protein FA13DRAFT_1741186 [Coprinellus micaceus]